jgi:hypothetical protein
MLKQVIHQVSFQELFKRVIAHPWVVILIVGAVTLLFALQMPRLSFKTSIYDLIIEDLPETAIHHKFKQIFGSDEIIRVVIKAENIFEPITFRKIESLSQNAAKISGVRRVISLPEIKKAVDISGKWPVEKFAQIVAPIDLFKKNIVSSDFKTTVLTLILSNDADFESVILAVNGLIAEQTQDLSLYQIGMPLVSQALVQLTERDFFRIPPVTILIIAVILLLLFRNFHGLFMPLICVICTLIWTFGLMTWARIPLSMLTQIVPVFLVAVGTAYCLHIMSAYIRCSQHSSSPVEVVARTYSGISFPTVLAVITTVIGLGSLLVNRIPTIREFAIFSCFGMFSLLVIMLTLLPAMMCVTPLPRKNHSAKSRNFDWLDRVINGIIHLDLNRQMITLPVLGGLVLFSILGIFRIKVETNPLGYFKEDVPVYRNFHDIYRDLSGSFPINLVMAGNEKDYFEDPGHIADIARIQEFLEKLPGVDKTVSFADYLKLVNYTTNGFDPKFYALPEEGWELRMVMNNYKTILGEDMFTRFMTPELSNTNILLLTHLSSSRQFLETHEKIMDHVQKAFAGSLSWDVTGFGMVISASSHLLTRGQIKSLSITIVLVFGIMFVLFLSSKVGFIAAATNLFPIVIIFGVMGWFNIELSMVTGLIASIAIGLAVDDTIHYLVHYNKEFRKDLDRAQALGNTLHKVGRPIIFTTLTISAGFSVLVLSSFTPTAVFGIMIVITMFAALVGDMILLPSLMMHVELVTLWDLVRLKMGVEPRHGIPLFQGMSRTQVHYICMAGALKKIDAGEILFQKGEQSDSMYAVISGEMDVVDHAVAQDGQKQPGFQKLLTTLKAGDVVGEMGLLRAVPRSATVQARKTSELLQVNLKMIQRMQWLYPSIAHKFFFNLMTVLCDRLENASHCLFEASFIDDLTGLCNQKGFMEYLDKEFHRSRRYHTDLSLCLITLEEEGESSLTCFDVNDPMLCGFSDAISGGIRKSDTLGRLDASTFALILPQTSAAKALVVRKRLEELLQTNPDFASGNELTIEFGLAGLVESGAQTTEQLFLQAQESMPKTSKLRIEL